MPFSDLRGDPTASPVLPQQGQPDVPINWQWLVAGPPPRHRPRIPFGEETPREPVVPDVFKDLRAAIVLGYQEQTGQSMPPSVLTAVLTAIQNAMTAAPGAVVAEVNDLLLQGDYVSLLKVPFIKDAIDNALYHSTGGELGRLTGAAARAAAAPPSPREVQAENIQNEFYSIFGRQLDRQTALRLADMTEFDRNQWLAQQPYRAGLTYGQFNDTYNKWDKQYLSLFGRHMNDDEVRWAAGKADDQVQEHINQSPSRIAGLNVGQFVAYKNALDDLSNKFYGHEAPDELIAEFHKAGL